jgi:hypothetical protein
MGRQHWVQQTGSREEHIARLRAQGVTDAEIAALIAQVEADAATHEAHQQAVGAPPAAEPKQRYRVRNWRAYNQALIQRGSLTLWFYEDSIRHWCANERPEETGRPTVYSDLAIQCMLTIKAVFQVALRQTQGLVASLIQLMGLTLPTPNYTTVSRRSATVDVDLETRARTEPMHVVVDSTGLKIFGEGEWKVRQHGWHKRRTWRKLHLGVDEATGAIVAHVMTEHTITDDTAFPDLLAQIPGPLEQVTADGADDTTDCYDAIVARDARPVIPPDANATDHGTDRARDRTVRRIGQIGRKAWKREARYHRRSLAETAMYRMKTIFGPRLSARTLRRQQTEAAIRCRALNRMTRLGMPQSYPVQDTAA